MMRHHVAEVGARRVLRPAVRAVTTSATGRGGAGGLLYATEQGGSQRSAVELVGGALTRTSGRARQDGGARTWSTCLGRTGQTAPLVAQLGLRTSRPHHSLPYGRTNLSVQQGTSWTSQALQTQRRWKSKAPRPVTDPARDSARRAAPPETSSTAKPSAEPAQSNYHLLDRLPHLHRPTKEELLAAATGFWHRLQIRFKWLTIRSARPFNSEEIFAFLSWIFWGHVLWVVIGTTTFVSLAIWAINTVFAQETLAGWVGNYLTRSSGVTIVFESAIVPTWKNGVITFNNVFLSRRPSQGRDKRSRSVSKGSSITAAAAAAEAASLTNKSDTTSSAGAKATTSATNAAAEPEDDGNYTQFDVTIQTVNVTLSFTKWFNGKGLLSSVSVHGLRGVLDRTNIQPLETPVDPKSYRHEHHIGDFEIDGFKMEDVLLTVYQPNDFRPFTVSVFNCELPRLRKQWLFYDFLSANNMSGSFDDSLFTVHPRQVHALTGATLASEASESSDTLPRQDAGRWKKQSRLRIDGLKIDHLNRGVEGPFSWISEGNVDLVADVLIPHDAPGSLAKAMSDFYERVEATVTQNTTSTQSQDHGADPTLHPSEAPPDPPLILDLRLHLNSIHATIPLLPNDSLSYTNTTLIRPITSYINSHAHTFIPITCRLIKPLSEFDGSWTVFDSGLLDDLSREVYEAFVRDIHDQRQRRRRIRKVGLWGVRVAVQALFLGLAGQLA